MKRQRRCLPRGDGANNGKIMRPQGLKPDDNVKKILQNNKFVSRKIHRYLIKCVWVNKNTKNILVPIRFIIQP
jgi:hypothetical protein